MDELNGLQVNKSQQFVFLNSHRLCGVQSVSFSFTKPIRPYQYLGAKSTIPYIYQGERATNITIDKLLNDKDLLWSYTGNSPINGCILQTINFENTNVSFVSGFLNSYNLSFQLGQIPQVSAQIISYYDAGSLNGTEGNKFDSDLYCVSKTPFNTNYISLGPTKLTNASNTVTSMSGYFGSNQLLPGDYFFFTGTINHSGTVQSIVDSQIYTVNGINPSGDLTGIAYKYQNPKRIGPGSIDLNISDFNTNRVNSLRMQLEMRRIPVFTIGNCLPKNVLLETPLSIRVDIQLEVKDYQLQKLTNYPTQRKIRDLSFNVRSYDDNSIIQSYNLGNMELISENYRSSVDGNVTVDMGFINYI